MPSQNEHQQGPALVPFEAYYESQERAMGEIDEISKLATHDQLSGALNRHGLERYLKSAEAPKAILLVDATNFKAVNDRYGYVAGDQLVIDTYKLLRKSVRPGDVITRWGGDEFVIILNGGVSENIADTQERRADEPMPVDHIPDAKNRIAEKVQAFLAERQDLQAVNLDLAVGGIEWQGAREIDEIKDLIRQAEEDMKLHKDFQHQNGRHR